MTIQGHPFRCQWRATKWLHSILHCESKKNMPPYFCPYLCQILTDFKNSFTGTICGKFAIKWLLVIPPHLNSVATLPCETLMSVKLAIAAVSPCTQRLFGHFRKFRQRSQQMIRTTLDCVRPVSLDTWRVERCVCGWSSWHNTSLLTVVSGHVLFSTPMLRSATPVPSVGAFCFPNRFQ